ncbi:prolyl oligopeptidase family serine peptidase [Bdellovibrio sp. HCB337]|uniref:prolyl oligopeptidase family serine peptidase n=1 Tax=Bdellovibrio sp. HCB337 TaxID=3394358 RepID=UPI0039A65F83
MSDSYIWLEDRNGSEATKWAQSESAIAKKHFESDPRFKQSSQEILNILTSKDKLAMPMIYEGYVYNLWQDDTHKRGIWRRTTVAEYKKTQPAWDILLDIDALSEKENEAWVYKGAVRMPGYDHVLVYLSRNNQDASEVREFSLSKKEFVKGGFTLPESKSNIQWFDENRLLVGATFTEDQRTDSGYARKIYLWTRGEDFSKAKLIFETKKEYVSSWSSVFHKPGGATIATVAYYVNYDHFESFILDKNFNPQKMPIPKDVVLSNEFKEHFIFENRSEWKGHPAGSLLAVPHSAMGLADVPADQVKAVFTPKDKVAFINSGDTGDRMYLILSENVRGQAYEAKLQADGSWKLEKVFNSDNNFEIASADPHGDTIIFLEDGFLQPQRLMMREGTASLEVKEAKSYFNEAPFVTEQLWVKSKDGTQIPYTVVRKKDLVYDGTNPTLLYGYGGFVVSLTPYYDAIMGKEWLEKGGVYVQANIRGGGEFGPEWHKAALLENKQKSYDDFIAIAEDLIARKITSPKHLGIQGGSNGGLLVGAVTMQRPELFNAVVCQIPLLDMLRYTKLPPGASWAGEYGNPDDPKFFEIISKYSPYQNVSKNKKYPKIYFQTTQADDRVHPGHARKMAARMKEYGHDFLFFESTDGGHGRGGVKPEDQSRASAYVYIYLYQQLAK